ncbi:hypothetical protein KR038_011096 [Drosophila bunnanda]|nr:hypothetical protein KR038_011096 [Drosophila bunnanda]
MSQNVNTVSGPKHKDFVVCPYNSCHRLLKSRLAVHLVRCSRSYPSAQMMQCIKKNSHDKACPNGCALEKAMKTVQLTQAEPKPPSFYVESTEDWDAEPPSGTYDPQAHGDKQFVIRNPQGNTPAARREFRARERRRFIENDKF